MTRLNHLETSIQDTKEWLVSMIDTMPDAPEIKKIGTHCCIISFSAISKHGGSLSPHTYMRDAIKEELKALVKNCQIENIRERFLQIALDKKLPKHGKIETDVANYLIQILAESGIGWAGEFCLK